MNKVTRYSAVLFAGLFAAACNSTDNPTAPTRFASQSVNGTSSTTVLAVTPSPLLRQPTVNPFCPIVPPFDVPFQLLIQGADIPVTVTDITMRFTDNFNVQMPPVTLTAPVLNAQLGSLQVPARSTRAVPLEIQIGCGTGVTGTLVIIVGTRDNNGQLSSSQTSAAVR
jgi:hypothetical protein